MTSAGTFSREPFKSEAGMEELLQSFDELEGWEEEDAFEELEELSGEFGALDGFEEDGFLPSASPRLISGPAAVVLARGLNPFILESMEADDAEAFIRRVARGVRGAVRSTARGMGQVRRVARPLLRRAAPLLRRALPGIQRVAGLAGPWGRVISAGIGATRGLMEGRGLRGALAGAAGGLIPGVGGRIASTVLRADGADDDGALDALADMADARQVPQAVALPMGAGLAARVVSRQAVPTGTPLGAAAQGAIRARTRALEQYLIRTAMQVQGSPGRRLRVLRAIARLAANPLRRREPHEAIGALPGVVQGVSRQVLARAARSPGIGTVPPRVAAQRVQARQQILHRIPISAVSTASLRHALA